MGGPKKQKAAQFPHDVYDYLDVNAPLKDALSKFLSVGGDELLGKMEGMARGDLHPYTAPLHVQATFGAFVGGVSWAVRTLRNAISKSNSLSERRRMYLQAGGNLEQETNDILKHIYPNMLEFMDAVEDRQKGQPK